jgi:hypothetical protein
MDAFESVVAMLLKRSGYWVDTCVKVELTKGEKRTIGRHSSPRWEIDVVAYRGSTNELLAVECKSFLDSNGVVFRKGTFDPAKRYKLFVDHALRKVVLRRLVRQLQKTGACARSPKVSLCMAIGKIAPVSDDVGLRKHFRKYGWKLYDAKWIFDELQTASKCGYENDVAFVVSKLLLRHLSGSTAAT